MATKAWESPMYWNINRPSKCFLKIFSMEKIKTNIRNEQKGEIKFVYILKDQNMIIHFIWNINIYHILKSKIIRIYAIFYSKHAYWQIKMLFWYIRGGVTLNYFCLHLILFQFSQDHMLFFTITKDSTVYSHVYVNTQEAEFPGKLQNVLPSFK